MENNEMPMGFGMALAQNYEAMQKFASFSEDKKQAVINGTHSICSKEEMRKYVDNMLNDTL